MNSINILITSAGRRVELVQCFREAANKKNIECKIITADLSKTAPAIYFSDKNYEVCRIKNKNYIQEIFKIIKDEKIDLVVPTLDLETVIFAENIELLESTGAKVLVSKADISKICFDKVETRNFLTKNGFLVAQTINCSDLSEIKYPVFIKPNFGEGSQGCFKVKNSKELEFFMDYIDQPIVEEFLEGEEYSVDVFLDFESNPITIVPRRRIEARSGEISKGFIIKDREIIEDIKKLLKVLKPIGHITIQCMKTAQGIAYIEINPRYGGGAPMSIKVGADSPAYLLDILIGKTLSYHENYREGVLGLRYDQCIYLDKEMKVIK